MDIRYSISDISVHGKMQSLSEGSKKVGRGGKGIESLAFRLYFTCNLVGKDRAEDLPLLHLFLAAHL